MLFNKLDRFAYVEKHINGEDKDSTIYNIINLLDYFRKSSIQKKATTIIKNDGKDCFKGAEICRAALLCDSVPREFTNEVCNIVFSNSDISNSVCGFDNESFLLRALMVPGVRINDEQKQLVLENAKIQSKESNEQEDKNEIELIDREIKDIRYWLLINPSFSLKEKMDIIREFFNKNELNTLVSKWNSNELNEIIKELAKMEYQSLSDDASSRIDSRLWEIYETAAKVEERDASIYEEKPKDIRYALLTDSNLSFEDRLGKMNSLFSGSELFRLVKEWNNKEINRLFGILKEKEYKAMSIFDMKKDMSMVEQYLWVVCNRIDETEEELGIQEDCMLRSTVEYAKLRNIYEGKYGLINLENLVNNIVGPYYARRVFLTRTARRVLYACGKHNLRIPMNDIDILCCKIFGFANKIGVVGKLKRFYPNVGEADFNNLLKEIKEQAIDEFSNTSIACSDPEKLKEGIREIKNTFEAARGMFKNDFDGEKKYTEFMRCQELKQGTPYKEKVAHLAKKVK